MLIYDPSGTNNRKTKQLGWVPGRSYTRPTRRKWEDPYNLRTAAKTTERARFALVASFWTLLSPSQIIAWNEAVSDYISKAPAGLKMPQSGFTLFMYVNLLLLASGSMTVMDPPAPVDVPSFSISDFQVSDSMKMSFTFSSDDDLANWQLSVSVEASADPGQMQPSNRWVRVFLNSVSDAQTITLSGAEYFPYGGIQEGQKLFANFFMVNKVTGQKSTSMVQSAIRPEQVFTNIIYAGQGSLVSPYGSSQWEYQIIYQPNWNVAESTLGQTLKIQISDSPEIDPDWDSATTLTGFTFQRLGSTLFCFHAVASSFSGQPTPVVGNAVALFAQQLGIPSDPTVSNILVMTNIIRSIDRT